MRLARTVTLFSGGGLIEAGLVGLIEPIFAVEYSRDIGEHYRRVWGDHVVIADVRGIDFAALAPQLYPVDYLHASPVCKNYSRSNVKKVRTCSSDRETELDVETAKATAYALYAFQPEVFTLENVGDYTRSSALAIVEAALVDLGYDHDKKVYEAALWGAATNRRRLIIRAVRNGLVPPLPSPSGPADWYATVADLIPTLKPGVVPPWMEERLAYERVPWRQLSVPVIVAGGSTIKKRIPYAMAGEPAFTIKATAGEKHRIIMPGGVVFDVSPRVLARLTGLPDAYPLPALDRLAKTIIGNGVPVALTRAVIGPLLESQQRHFHGPRA